jgi:hypothetical protein
MNNPTEHPEMPPQSLPLTEPTAQHIEGLLARLRAVHGPDEQTVERAFHDELRAAWTLDEPWAVEYVAARTVSGRA